MRKLEDGAVFESSEGINPLGFTIGENQVLKKFEDSVAGLAVGDKIHIFIPASEADGVRNEQIVAKVPKINLPPELKPEVRMKLQSQTPEGEVMVVKVIEVGDDDITIDVNHEFADKE